MRFRRSDFRNKLGDYKTLNILQEAAKFTNPKPAFSEVSGRTFSGIVNRNHVTEANFSSRNVANSLSSYVMGSCFFFFFFFFQKSSSVHVERSNPVLGASTSARFHTSRNPFCVSDDSKDHQTRP